MSFFVLENQYGRLYPDLAAALAPLNQLPKKDAQWKWGQQQQENCQPVNYKVQHMTDQMGIMVSS